MPKILCYFGSPTRAACPAHLELDLVKIWCQQQQHLGDWACLSIRNDVLIKGISPEPPNAVRTIKDVLNGNFSWKQISWLCKGSFSFKNTRVPPVKKKSPIFGLVQALGGITPEITGSHIYQHVLMATRAARFWTALNICGSLVWNLLHVSLLVSSIWQWPPTFLEILFTRVLWGFLKRLRVRLSLSILVKQLKTRSQRHVKTLVTISPQKRDKSNIGVTREGQLIFALRIRYTVLVCSHIREKHLRASSSVCLSVRMYQQDSQRTDFREVWY